MKRLVFLVLLIATLALPAGVATAQTPGAAIITPAGPVWAAWQPFQGGVMMWWSDTRQIWVLFNSTSTVLVFPDAWVGEPLAPVAAPPGLYTPERGFGKVWRMLGGPGSGLGYAMAPELGYDTAARLATGNPTTVTIDGPGETVYSVTIPFGSNFGTWQVLRMY